MQPQDPSFAAPINPAARVAGPATGLIVTGVLGGLTTVAGLFGRGALMALIAANPHFHAGPGMMLNGLGSMVGTVLGLAASGFVIFAGLQMRQGRQYVVAVIASIVAMVPCFSPCCCVGLPIGIWSLVVLLDQNVRSGFMG